MHNTGVKRRATQPLFYGKDVPTTERSNARLRRVRLND
jgi:hypothetical protein